MTASLPNSLLDRFAHALLPQWATPYNPIVKRDLTVRGKQLKHMLSVVIELILIQALLLALVPVRFSLLAALPFSIAAFALVPYAIYLYAVSLFAVIDRITKWMALQRRYGPLDMLRLTCVSLRETLLGIMTVALLHRIHTLYRVLVLTTILSVPVVSVIKSVQPLMELPPRWMLLIVLVALPVKLITDTLLAGVISLWMGTLFRSPVVGLAATVGMAAFYTGATVSTLLVPDWGFRLVVGVFIPLTVGVAGVRWLPGLLARYIEVTA